ncbi:MAG: PKD domain-containing protein [Rhizobacter sp.]|nr:PKD domain-containing protein [Ferruginibacter sp.]
MTKLLGGIIFLLISSISFAQDFSNKGKEFYLCFPTHVHNAPANLATLSIYITSDKASSGTITMANGAFTGTFNIVANGLQEIQIPWSALRHISNAEANTVIKKSINIKVNPGMPAVVAYAQQWAGARSAATLLLPVNVLGKKYYATSFTQTGSDNNGVLARSQFQVIAIKNNTVVSITPRKNGVLQPAFTITLPVAGDMYEYQSTDGNAATQDLTGTYIESVASGSGGCLPIAVFSGSSNVTFGIAGCTTGNSFDPLWQQMYPVSTWGKNFGFIPSLNYRNGNPYRVMASEDNTNVYFNGALTATINAGEIYPAAFTNTPVTLSAPALITADKPISVAQYLQRNACKGPAPDLRGDPDMVILNPIEQNISDISIFSSTNQNIAEQYVNVLTKTNSTASFLINGAPIITTRGDWLPATTIPGYSFLRYSLSGYSAVRLQGDSGFNAIAYGYGDNESYAYSAGTYIRDLAQQLGVNSQYGIETGPSTCIGSPFEFKVCFPAFNANGTPYVIDSMDWNSSNAGVMIPSNFPRRIINPVIDSTRIINGKPVNWYHLTGLYTFSTPGIYTITITNYTSGSDACGAEQDFEFELEVSNPPVAAFNWTHNGCIDQPVQFNDQTSSVKPIYRWWWSFDDPASGAANNTSALQNPIHTFSTPGTYNVRYSNITTPGCLSDTITLPIVISPLPSAVISGDVTVCQNQPAPNVVFTGSTGTAPYTFTYNINNGAAQTVTTTTGNSISLPVATGTTGTFNYHLVSVTDNGGTAGCSRNTTDTVRVVVNPLASAVITGSTTVCQDAAAPVITFTASGGSIQPFTFSYTINSGPVQTISTVTGNSVTLPVPTATAGTFVYNLVSVRDASVTACSQLQTGAATVIVNPLPAATVAGTTEVCVGGTSPAVIFTGTGSTAPYTFTYTINSGAPQTIISTGNTAAVTVPTTTAGNFVYTLVSVTDASSTACLQAQTGSATVTVHPLPTAAFNFSTPSCATRAINFTDNSTPNVGALNGWNWNFGDPASGTANTSTLQNPTHVFAGAGPYTVTLIVTNNEGCTSVPVQRLVTISTLPTAAFTLPEVCLLDPFAQFTDNSTSISPATITSWQWNFGDPASGANNTSTIQNAQHAYTLAGPYTVRLIVTTNNGCTHTLDQPLFVNGGNPVSNFIQLNPATSCSSDSVAIQNKSTIATGVITKVDIHWDNTNQPAVFQTDNDPVFDRIYRHKYPTSTTTVNYNVRFRAYSGNTCVNDRIIPVTVLATPDVAIANIPDQCYTTTPLVLNFGSEGGGVAGTETYSGPGVSFNGTNWIFHSTVAGIGGPHEIKYKFTATAGGCVDSTSTSVQVLDTAFARFTLQRPACEKNTVSFTEQSTAPSSVTLANTVWDFGDGTAPQTLPVGGIVTHVYAAAGPYTVTMYNIAATTGCRSATTSQQITIDPLPAPGFTFPASVCLPGAAVSFTDASSIVNGTENTFTYLWNFGDAASAGANTSTVKDPTHIYTAVGPYNVKLQVTSGAGCVHDTTIVLNTIHPQPKADFDISRAAICLGDDISFNSTSNGGDGTITDWSWNFDDGSAPSALQNPSHLYTTANNYNVSHFITNSFGCNSDTTRKPFKVYAPPTVNGGADVYVLEGGTGTLEPVYTGEDNIYLWSPSDYLNSTTVPRPVTKPLTDITYTITVSNPGGCTQSAQVIVKLLKGPNIPNTFSPNGDGINDRWIIEYLDTYPNCKVLVFTRTGQKVYESRGYKVPWNGTINGKTLPLDTYYYIIEPENGRKPVTGYITIIK